MRTTCLIHDDYESCGLGYLSVLPTREGASLTGWWIATASGLRIGTTLRSFVLSLLMACRMAAEHGCIPATTHRSAAQINSNVIEYPEMQI